ncbi:DUF2278 family protein [Streptomyces sp. N2A]|uniref:DUF2278 family protein n=1 Tax=Streptomyces sp. N2A TaxID=3073936 RepID=UPI0028700B95|nr:DUF2278 family protein [Streptomyces sp. N2A]
MPLKNYGVLACRAVERRREGAPDETPHYQLHLTDNAGTHYRAAINVKSQQRPPDLLFVADDNFRHPLTGLLPAAGSGWQVLPSKPGTASLDFIRGNLFPPDAVRPLPPDLPGMDNDLEDMLDHHVARAIADANSEVYLFGERYGPEPSEPDKVFGFRPGNGVHEIHMNQGSTGQFRPSNGVWQDGGLLLHFPAESRWVAVFLAFQSQAWHTDETTGHPLTAAPPRPATRDASVRILAALVNPTGPAPERETVTLLNASPVAIDLDGWRLADQKDHLLPLPAQPLAAGATLAVSGGNEFQLGNHGGSITLLDPAGLKVDGVSYTEEQAQREGWTVAF